MGFVLLCALPPEAIAAWAGLRRDGAAGARGRVRLVGTGPRRSRKAAARLASALPDGVPTVVLGVGGALLAGTKPGDLVVANAFGTADDGDDGKLEVSRPPLALDARSAAFSDQVAAALSARFGPVRQAPVLSARRTATGGERRLLGRSGAVVCDTESYWLSRLAERRPFAVVRSIVDTPERELLSTQTITGGLTGLRRLADAAELIAALLTSQPTAGSTGT